MLKELGKRIVLLDGAMGTQLQARGLAPGELPETWNLIRPEDVQAIHEAYLAAGADVVTTNTFGANALKCGEDAAAVVRAGVEIARAAVRKAGRGLVALDLGPTGRLLRPYGDLDFADAVALYAQAAEAGRAATRRRPLRPSRAARATPDTAWRPYPWSRTRCAAAWAATPAVMVSPAFRKTRSMR